MRLINRVPVGSLLLIAGCLAAFVLGSGCATDDAPADGVTAADDDSERQRVRDFWRAYREATRLRLAGDFEPAYELYKQALDLNDSHEDALYYQGNVAVELGKWTEAEQAWHKLVAANPSSSRGHAQLGQLYMCRPEIPMFNVPKATASFRESLRLNREETGPVLRLAEVFLLSGEVDSAAVYFDAVIASNPGSAEARFMRAFIDWRRGDEQSAMQLIRAAPSPAAEEGEDQFSGEGDTRAGSGPMLAPTAGCSLFEPFGQELPARRRDRDAVIADFQQFADRIELALR